jgi:hypothetical protein
MILRLILLWLIRRVRSKRHFPRKYAGQRVTTFEGLFLFWRFTPFWDDEYVGITSRKHYHRPPWWRPFNALLHQWIPTPDTREGVARPSALVDHHLLAWAHDRAHAMGRQGAHARQGVFRSRKYIHASRSPRATAARPGRCSSSAGATTARTPTW